MKTSMVQMSRKRSRSRVSKNRTNKARQKTTTATKVEGSVLTPGKKAPNFSLNSTPDQKVALSDFLGQPVILAFYPADWSPVCTDQLSLYAEIMPEFKKHNAELLAISVDNIWSHLAFSKDRKLNFPVLADFEPKGTVSRKYGAFKEAIGESARALFVIDDKGVIRWSHLSPDGVNPGADGILRALESLNQPVQAN
jgi:peroxiredoxin